MIRKLAAIACCWAGMTHASDMQLHFDVYLDDRPIGVHRVILDRSGGEKRVQVEARFDIKFLAFTAYKYRHSADELWRDGCIVELETSTNDNGKQLTVDAQPALQGLEVSTRDDSATLDGCVRTFAYWDPGLLNSQRLLNTQTGEYELTSLQQVDSEPLSFNGRQYGPTRYRLSVRDKADIELWYAPDNSWQALQTTVAGGKILRYVRKEA
ncbi:MAG: DUF6134 family protein [Gammaproteobacteria bacterium]|jgi:hypothetical protein